MIMIDSRSSVAPFEQIRAWFAAQINSGALVVGTRLPTVRRLAQDLGVAVNTVHRAYQELEAGGLIETNGRAGTTVSATGDQARARVHAAATVFADVAHQTGMDRDQAIRIVTAALTSKAATH